MFLQKDKGEGKVGKEPRLEPCLSVLLIGSLSAMWAWWGKQFHEPKCGSGHVCQFNKINSRETDSNHRPKDYGFILIYSPPLYQLSYHEKAIVFTKRFG